MNSRAGDRIGVPSVRGDVPDAPGARGPARTRGPHRPPRRRAMVTPPKTRRLIVYYD